MEEQYGLERSKRIIEGNIGADKLADKGMTKNKLLAPLITKYHNRYLLKSTRKNTSKISSFKGYVNEDFRGYLKKQI